MNKKIIILLILGIMALLLGGVMFYYEYSLGAVSDDETSVIIEIKEGTSAKEIINQLYEANLIKNKYPVYFYYKMKGNLNLQAGNYMLNRTMDVENILKKISSGDTINEVVQITFKEGKWVPKYVSLISEGFGYQESEIYDIISDVAYLKELIDKYWFLTEDILNESIYYPLEGYLYPDTYIFSKEATIKEIIEKILDNTNAKLEPYKALLTSSDKYSIHEYMTMASIIELEANKEEDRKKVSQVLYKRLDSNDTLGSDVTTYYGAKKSMSEELSWSELGESNAYNTRVTDGSMNGKLPVGPITNPTVTSIDAALNKALTDYYYFIANVCTGEVFFTNTIEEHITKGKELSNICELN